MSVPLNFTARAFRKDFLDDRFAGFFLRHRFIVSGVNHTRLRNFNGDHLTLPGASGAIQLHSHQKAGVWRILQTPNTLLAHVVGAGKTYTMVAAAMESRRLGLSGKPMFVVPNHMLGQFSTELLTLYPDANILTAGKEDFESQNRKKLFSRIATGNWDAVKPALAKAQDVSASKRWPNFAPSSCTRKPRLPRMAGGPKLIP
jgi:N12 class adenine-specific DNA methylase